MALTVGWVLVVHFLFTCDVPPCHGILESLSSFTSFFALFQVTLARQQSKTLLSRSFDGPQLLTMILAIEFGGVNIFKSPPPKKYVHRAHITAHGPEAEMKALYDWSNGK